MTKTYTVTFEVNGTRFDGNRYTTRRTAEQEAKRMARYDATARVEERRA